MNRSNSSRSIGIPSGPCSGPKSPMTQDRFMKSPVRMNSFHENQFMNDFDCHNLGMLSGPGTPKSNKIPQVTQRFKLDAPYVKTDPPVKLIDMNNRNELVIAIENSVYIWKDGRNHVLMEGDVPIDGVCWVGNHVAISGCGHVEIWDVQQEEAIQEFYDHDRRAAAMSSYEFDKFATGGSDGVVCMFDLRTNRNNRLIKAHHGQVCTLSWSPDGMTLASGGDDCDVCVFEPKQKVHIKHEAPVHALTWMKPGLLVTGQANRQGCISIFNMKTGERKSEATGASISGICMTERWGLLVGHDNSSSSWDIWTHDLNRKLAECNGHRESILTMTSNADGSFVGTISADETLILWELNQSALTPIQQSRVVPNQCKSPRSMRSPGPKSPYSSMPRSPTGYGYNLR